MDDIVVTGYPRSGNVWTARLLGDALDFPVVGIQGGWGSLAAEGFDRPGPRRVMQTHFWPKHGQAFRGEHLCVDPRYREERQLLLVVRDPRDMAVSISHHWKWTLDRTLDLLINGPGPLSLPPWHEYVTAWLHEAIPYVRYEDLYRNALVELEKVLCVLDLVARKPLADVVERQSFSVKRKEMEQHGDTYSFGREAQLEHLRSGKTGEWKGAFSDEQAVRAIEIWGPLLKTLGYIEDA